MDFHKMVIYGKELSPKETKSFVLDYLDKINEDKRSRYHSIQALVPNDSKRVLDYGCGWGILAMKLAKEGHYVEGIDFSPNEIEICKTTWDERKNLQYSEKKITDFEPKSFDAIVSTQVIEHVHNVGNYVNGISNALVDGGHLIISLPNIVNPRFGIGLMRGNLSGKLLSVSQHMIKNYRKAHDHINGWDPVHFVQLMASMGYLLEEYVPLEGVPFPNKKPFIPYWKRPFSPFKNLSYTMAFRFKKVAHTIMEQNA